MIRKPALSDDNPWIEMRDGNATARAIFDNHYLRYFYKDGRKPKLFVGPGQKLVLLTRCARALFVWRKFISRNNQHGVNCAVFRNEGAGLSSHLILYAEEFARRRWGSAERFYTYVDPRKVRSNNPGYCFLMAGWRKCGITERRKRKLLIMEKQPGWLPLHSLPSGRYSPSCEGINHEHSLI